MTDQYAVFGNPIAHSKSPDIHMAFARDTGENIHYTKVRVDDDKFELAAREFFDQGGCGLNITVPFKLEAFKFADQLSLRAQTAGAVNTLKRQPDGSILGDNTDGQGMVSDILDDQGWQIQGKRVLILGAGGAVRGVLQPLLAHAPKLCVIANRTSSKAKDLAESFSEYGNIQGCGFDDLTGQQFDLVINGTSASLSGELPPLPKNLLSQNANCYDMMYGNEPTVFLRWAQTQGSIGLADGLGMLVGQAAEAFHVWRHIKPATKNIIAQLRGEL